MLKYTIKNKSPEDIMIKNKGNNRADFSLPLVPCHAELVSASHTKVDSQLKEEIPEQVQNDMKGKFLVPQYLSALVPSKRVAFTLAEVLITLGIIGVLAAMTMPALIQNHREKVTVTKLKKFYSKFSRCLDASNYTKYTAWVILNGNMDYLHCKDLSWNGKTKCK